MYEARLGILRLTKDVYYRLLEKISEFRFKSVSEKKKEKEKDLEDSFKES